MVNTPATYTVSSQQRERVFTHVLGLVMHMNALLENKVQNGVDALEVLSGYAKEHKCEDIVETFYALPGEPYQDFIHYWNKIFTEEEVQDDKPHFCPECEQILEDDGHHTCPDQD